VLLRRGDGDAGRHPGEQHAAGDFRGAAHDGAVAGRVLVGAPDRHRQAAAHGGQHGAHLVQAGAAHDQAARAEHFLAQFVALDEALRADLQQLRARRGRCALALQQRQRARVHEALDTGVEGLAHAGGQHRVRLLLGQRLRQLRDEGLGLGAVHQHQQARVGAELAAAQGDGAGQQGGQFDALGGQRRRQGDQRVDRAQLAIEGDRARAGVGLGLQRRTAAGGTGEGARSDQRVADQADTDLDAHTLHQADQPRGQALLFQHALDDGEHLLRQARVAGMGLDDHRAAGGQCRGGVTAQHREGKREVAGREHGHRAQRHALAHHGRVAGGRAPGHGRVVQRLERHAALCDVGEAAQLEGGAVEFAVQAHRAERGFQVGPGDELFTFGFEAIGQSAQQGRTLFAAAAGPVAEGGMRLGDGAVDVGGGGFGQGFAVGFAGACVEGLQGAHVVG
jgi:hypothetical protein